MVERIERVFVGVDIDDETLHALAATLAEVDIPGKPVPPSNWHITLRFVGSIDEVTFDRLSAALDQADMGEAFQVAFGGLGAFPRPRRANVFWRAIERDGGRLAEIAEHVEEACQEAGLDAEDRPYRPHLTLARIRPDRDVRSILATPLEPVRMDVSEVCLFRSHLGRGGAQYAILERFPLHRATS